MSDKSVIDTAIAEAGGSTAGLTAVLYTIANRAARSGQTPTQVVESPGQYEGYSNPGSESVKAQQDAKVRAKAERIWQAVQTGAVPDPTDGGLNFRSDALASAFDSSPNGTVSIGGNTFEKSNAPSSALSAINAAAPVPQSRPTSALAFAAPDTGTAPTAPGMIAPGNIDLAHRPIVPLTNGSIATVRSVSFGLDNGQEVLVPTVSPDGRILTNQQALDLYEKTGQNLGIFSSALAADKYAEQLHQDQAKLYGGKAPTVSPIGPPVPSSFQNLLPAAMNGVMRAPGAPVTHAPPYSDFSTDNGAPINEQTSALLAPTPQIPAPSGLTSRSVQTVPINPMTGNPTNSAFAGSKATGSASAAPSLQDALNAKAAAMAATLTPSAPQVISPSSGSIKTVGQAGNVQMPPITPSGVASLYKAISAAPQPIAPPPVSSAFVPGGWGSSAILDRLPASTWATAADGGGISPALAYGMGDPGANQGTGPLIGAPSIPAPVAAISAAAPPVSSAPVQQQRNNQAPQVIAPPPTVQIATGKSVPVGSISTAQGGKYTYQVQSDGSIKNLTTGRTTSPATN